LFGTGGIELPAGVRRHERRGSSQNVRGRAAEAPVDLRGDGRAIDEEPERPADERVAEDQVGRLDAGSLTVDLAPGIAEVQQDLLDGRGRGHHYAPAPAPLQPAQHFVFLEVPGVVAVSGLEHCAGRRDGIAATLQFQRVEERPAGDVVVRGPLGADHVARPELDAPVWPGADGMIVGGHFPGPAAERTEHVPGEDLPGVGPTEGLCPEGGRFPEHDADRVIVELLDSLQVSVPSSHPAVDRVLPREHDVVGGERAAIVPVDAPLQVPDDRASVGRHLTVLPARNPGRQHWHEARLRIECGQRLVEDAGCDAISPASAGRGRRASWLR
jgi:hypothetical protein